MKVLVNDTIQQSIKLYSHKRSPVFFCFPLCCFFPDVASASMAIIISAFLFTRLDSTFVFLWCTDISRFIHLKKGIFFFLNDFCLRFHKELSSALTAHLFYKCSSFLCCWMIIQIFTEVHLIGKGFIFKISVPFWGRLVFFATYTLSNLSPPFWDPVVDDTKARALSLYPSSILHTVIRHSFF